MKFLSDILAKAGLTVDGVVTFNNTATGQTPATNDNSTKLATTAFIKNQSYLTANQTITVSGDATGSGTTSIALTLANSGVTAGTYGNASNIPTIVVDAKGRITSISTNAVSIITTLAGLSDVTLTSPSVNQVLQYNGTRWVNGAAPTTYSLPIATDTILGGIKVGSGLTIDSVTGVLTATGGVSASNVRNIQKFTATAGQTVFTITTGYIPGLVDIFVNGVKLDNSGDFTATNGSTVTLTNAVLLNDIVEAYCYINTFAANNALRTTTYFTATAGQTTFTVDYNPGFIDIFYNGSKLASTEYTATNGTSVVFNTACTLNDAIEILSYTYSVNGFTGVSSSRTLTINGTTYDLSANRTWTITNATLGAQPQLNGTGLVRMSGTTVSYDNATYATQSYVTTAVANLVNSAPSTLDTLNELATALGNDANFATTITTSIGTKQAQLNGTGFVKISGTTISYDNNSYYLASNPNSYITLASLSVTGPLTYNSSTGAFNINKSSSTVSGWLSYDDWVTFNSKQPAGNYVTTDTTQSISGAKTFTTQLWIGSNAVIGGSNGQIQFDAAASSDLFISCIPGTRTIQIRNGNSGAPNYAACGLITGYAYFKSGVSIDAGGDNLTLTRSTFASHALGVGTVAGINGLHFNVGSTTWLSISETGLPYFKNSINQADPNGSVSSNQFSTYNGGSTTMKFNYNTSGSVIWANGSDRMFLTGDGYLGVGITPTYPLHITSTIANYTAGIINTSSGNNAGLLIKAGINSGNEILRCQTGTGANRFLVDVSGEITSTDGEMYFKRTAFDNYGHVYMGSNRHFYIRNSGNYNMYLQTSGVNHITLQNDGVTVISQLRTSTLYSDFAINLNGSYSNGTYYKICDSSQLTTSGIYMIVAYVDTYAIGGGIYFCTFASVPFYWFAGSSNSGSIQTLPTMLGTGHHNLNPPIVRIRLSTGASSDGGKQFLEFDPNANWSNVQGVSGATVTFYVKRIGS